MHVNKTVLLPKLQIFSYCQRSYTVAAKGSHKTSVQVYTTWCDKHKHIIASCYLTKQTTPLKKERPERSGDCRAKTNWKSLTPKHVKDKGRGRRVYIIFTCLCVPRALRKLSPPCGSTGWYRCVIHIHTWEKNVTLTCRSSVCLLYDTKLTIDGFGKSKTHKMSTKCDKMSNKDASNIFKETKTTGKRQKNYRGLMQMCRNREKNPQNIKTETKAYHKQKQNNYKEMLNDYRWMVDKDIHICGYKDSHGDTELQADAKLQRDTRQLHTGNNGKNQSMAMPNA